jgi:hypothetical protein
MKYLLPFACAFIACSALTGGAARANTCQAETLTCATAMPVDGYCECTSHGVTQGGTVTRYRARMAPNSTAGGCGAEPHAPGCR